MAFIRGYKDLCVGSAGTGDGIESVSLGYNIPNGQILLQVDYKTLNWEIHRNIKE